MKIFAAAIAFAMGTGMALAQGGAGPPTPITAFCMWEKEGAAGKPLTSMSELIRKAHDDEGLNNARKCFITCITRRDSGL